MQPTSKERRNIVELMRGEAADFRRLGEEHGDAWTVDLGDVPAIFQDITHYVGLDGVVRADALFDRLADPIDRPTCRNLAIKPADELLCSECGEHVDIAYMENADDYHARYCPNCGAEVER